MPDDTDRSVRTLKAVEGKEADKTRKTGFARVLAPFSPQAGMAAEMASTLLDASRTRALDERERSMAATIIAGLEAGLA